MGNNLIIGLEMLTVGVTAVFVALSVFAGLIFLMKVIDISFQKRKQKENISNLTTVADKESTEQVSEITEDKIPAEVVAVISAAIYTTFGKRVVIKRFTSPSAQSSNWAFIGRQILQGSHQLKNK